MGLMNEDTPICVDENCAPTWPCSRCTAGETRPMYVRPRPVAAELDDAQTTAYAEGRNDEREAAIAYFEKVARETDDQSPLGKAHWCRAAADALRNGWHS